MILSKAKKAVVDANRAAALAASTLKTLDRLDAIAAGGYSRADKRGADSGYSRAARIAAASERAAARAARFAIADSPNTLNEGISAASIALSAAARRAAAAAAAIRARRIPPLA